MNKVEPREGKQLSAGAHCLAREKLVDSVEEEAQQLFVCVIILVANNLPLHQLILLKVVPGLKLSANCRDRYHPAHLLH